MTIRNVFWLCVLMIPATQVLSQQPTASPEQYLNDIKQSLSETWPDNHTINLLFHGHSVPAGYFKTPEVHTLQSYPYLLLKELKMKYPFAVINIINTAIGGENSVHGETRFANEVLKHQPDVIFIDYALNDLGVGLEKAKVAWESMIQQALAHQIKVILLTPTPDQRIDLLNQESDLEKHAAQIRALAAKYQIGLVDSYTLFRNRVIEGDKLSELMSQVNHPNEAGHQLVTTEILRYF